MYSNVSMEILQLALEARREHRAGTYPEMVSLALRLAPLANYGAQARRREVA